ncbi:uncharacterized protein EDB91DRAFT_1006336, partial [Suillus paluster]|uniref:uncharacterized protein n=1 Tax=Suillus paluster TaxID=48578 RepID=UPI001B87F9FF
LQLPSTAITELLPDPSLSIIAFLKFPLPVISKIDCNISVEAYFSHDQPNVEDLNKIKSIPLPPSSLLEKLLDQGLRAALEQQKVSVQCPHTPIDSKTCLPLWVITYWAEVLHLRRNCCQHWIEAEHILESRSCSWKAAYRQDTHDLIKQVYNLLGSLPWSGNVLGFENQVAMHHLTIYITHDWLFDVHENQMLDLLRTGI